MGRRGTGAFAVALLAALALSGGSAAASQDIDSFAATTSTTQAGGNPDIGFALSLDEGSAEAVDSVAVDWPEGINLVPFTVVRCLAADLAAEECPPTSQVGLVTIRGDHEGDPDHLLGTAAVYSLLRAGDEFARLGFVIPTLDVPVTGTIELRSDLDYGARLTLDGFPQATALQALNLTIWGVPAGPEHDSQRFPEGTTGCPGAADTGCLAGPTPSSLPVLPFTLNPTQCGSGLSIGVSATTHEDPGQPATDTAGYPSTTGCSQISFNPSIDTDLTATAIRAPTGLDMDLKVPQVLSVTTPSASQIRFAETGFDGAVRVDPDLLHGHAVCGEAQLDACPPGSKLGTAKVTVANVEETLEGELFLLEPGPEEDVVMLSATGPGVDLQLFLYLEEPGPPEHELFLGFFELPQLPIERIELHFPSGPASPFLTGNRCDEALIGTLFVPWDAALTNRLSNQSQTLVEGLGGGPCPGPAQRIAVRLEPDTIAADGNSGTLATARVSDGAGVAVLDDDVHFSSSDPGVRVGAVTDNEDGTYSALVTSSTTPGSVTITATDLSVAPPAAGSTTLTQLAIGRAAPAPVARIVKHPPRRTRKRRVSFSFTADLPGSTFSCRLDRRPLRRCASPTTFAGIRRGPHTFSVFATGPAGSGPPATFSFRVKKQRQRKRHRR